jgi:hypothetical protein
MTNDDHVDEAGDSKEWVRISDLDPLDRRFRRDRRIV